MKLKTLLRVATSGLLLASTVAHAVTNDSAIWTAVTKINSAAATAGMSLSTSQLNQLADTLDKSDFDRTDPNSIAQFLSMQSRSIANSQLQLPDAASAVQPLFNSFCLNNDDVAGIAM